MDLGDNTGKCWVKRPIERVAYLCRYEGRLEAGRQSSKANRASNSRMLEAILAARLFLNQLSKGMRPMYAMTRTTISQRGEVAELLKAAIIEDGIMRFIPFVLPSIGGLASKMSWMR